MTPTTRSRPGRRDWVLCGVDVAAVVILLTLSSLTGVPHLIRTGAPKVEWGGLNGVDCVKSTR